MKSKLIKVEKTCDVCLCEFTFDVDEIGFELWRSGAEHIQWALPNLSAGYRELLLTGTCGACFDDMCPEEDEDWDEFEDYDLPIYNDEESPF